MSVRGGGGIGAQSGPTFGLEEEVFVTSATEPTLESLYFLARLMWRNPRRYYRHSDSNFARGRDVRLGLMSGVEISTGRHATPEAAVADLCERRADLARACRAPGVFLVPVGHLLDRDTPTNVCGLHIHVGLPAEERMRGYRRLAAYLPLLALLAASSPCRRGAYFGPSYRMVAGYATGALRPDHMYRFQDLIVSRRLGTIEARLFDPVWDVGHVLVLLRCMRAILLHAPDRAVDYALYAQLRHLAATRGYGEEFEPLWREVNEYLRQAGEAEVREGLFADPPAREIFDLYESRGLEVLYRALHHGYCRGLGEAEASLAEIAGVMPSHSGPSVRTHGRRVRRFASLRAAGGFMSYYVIRLPYKTIKVLRESGKERASRDG
ncbi:MAG: glutamate-cysteine ligase family protein [Bacillota bacterium]|nr:glutamate-cysteine ligase family protein [Bacillota bacterium]